MARRYALSACPEQYYCASVWLDVQVLGMDPAKRYESSQKISDRIAVARDELAAIMTSLRAAGEAPNMGGQLSSMQPDQLPPELVQDPLQMMLTGLAKAVGAQLPAAVDVALLNGLAAAALDGLETSVDGLGRALEGYVTHNSSRMTDAEAQVRYERMPTWDAVWECAGI
jgi:hypothetical protein